MGMGFGVGVIIIFCFWFLILGSFEFLDLLLFLNMGVRDDVILFCIIVWV